MRTVSEDMMLGTAMSSSSDASFEDVGGRRGVCANEQKFIVLTCRMWRSHGCFRGSSGVSTGKIVLMDASSSSDSFHTMSLLSLPCLQTRQVRSTRCKQRKQNKEYELRNSYEVEKVLLE